MKPAAKKKAARPSSPRSEKREQNTPTTLVPKLRFPEFRRAEGWEQNILAGACDLQAGKFVSASNIAERNENGLFPCYGGNGLRGYTQTYTHDGRYSLIGRQGALCGNVRLVGGKFHATEHAVVATPMQSIDVGWLYYSLDLLKLNRFATGQAQPGLSVDVLENVSLAIPKQEAEQNKIAECVSSVDELIGAQARKLDALKTHKKGLMQQLFPREGEAQPRLRFPEFQNAGEWVEDKLDDLLHFQDGFAFKSTDFVKSKKDATQVIRITDINNKNTNEDKVYIPNAFLEASKLGKYTVDDGDLLLSLTGAAGFNFFFWDGGPATINQRTAKVTAKKKANRDLLRLLEPLIHEKINARGEGQNNNLSKEFLSSIVLMIPESEEQQRISSCLTTLDNLITAQTQKLEALKIHKKGLMQQLFPAPEATGARQASPLRAEEVGHEL